MYWGTGGKSYGREKKKKKRKRAENSLRQIYSVAKAYIFLEQEGKWQIINMKW